MFFLCFLCVFLRPGSTVHCINCFSPPPNSGQNTGKKSDQKSGQKSVQKSERGGGRLLLLEAPVNTLLKRSCKDARIIVREVQVIQGSDIILPDQTRKSSRINLTIPLRLLKALTRPLLPFEGRLEASTICLSFSQRMCDSLRKTDMLETNLLNQKQI